MRLQYKTLIPIEKIHFFNVLAGILVCSCAKTLSCWLINIKPKEIVMRIIGEIPNPNCKITLYSWNNRYLIKLEQGFLEQTYKIDQFELTSENDLQKIVNTEFINDALSRFDAMATSLQRSLEST